MNEAVLAGNTPFFIVGCSRSGTTLLQTLLDGHPNLAIPPESEIYSRFGKVFHTYGDLDDDKNRLGFITALLKDAAISEWDLKASPSDVERRVLKPSRAGVLEALFSLYAEKVGAQRWGDKTPKHIAYLDMIRSDFPAAKLIHLVRDGRDVAEAFRRMLFGPVTALGLGREWHREVSHWNSFVSRHGNDGTMVVRYEELVGKPQETLAAILDFLGESFVDTVETYSSTPLTQNLSTNQSAWHSSLSRGISKNKIGIYKKSFSSRDIEVFESVAGDQLEAFGYRICNASPRPATFGERMSAFFVDRLVRWWRKLFHPKVIWQEVQLRGRLVYRRLLYGLFK